MRKSVLFMFAIIVGVCMAFPAFASITNESQINSNVVDFNPEANSAVNPLMVAGGGGRGRDGDGDGGGRGQGQGGNGGNGGDGGDRDGGD